MTPVAPAKKGGKFDSKRFLSTVNGGRKVVAFPKKQAISVQGDPSDAVFMSEKEGKTHRRVEERVGSHHRRSERGRLLRRRLPFGTASPDEFRNRSVMRIEKKAMIEVLHRGQEFSDVFVAHLLTRNIRYEEDLVDQLLNSSEKRLARMNAGEERWAVTLGKYWPAFGLHSAE